MPLCCIYCIYVLIISSTSVLAAFYIPWQIFRKAYTTYKAKCTECEKEVLPGQAFWSSSQKAARHLTCNGPTSRRNNERSESDLVIEKSNLSDIASTYQEKIIELKCFICGSKTGCSKCEYLVGCQQKISLQILHMLQMHN